jgi:hypothetical protein
MKQTAVEWFEDQVGHNSLMGLKEFNEIFEKAKEMEKEQIIKAHTNGWNKGIQNKLITSQEYYNETFKQQQQ